MFGFNEIMVVAALDAFPLKSERQDMKIRKIEISNFRSIQNLDWIPSEGINCLVGSGDSGKSTILDAIEWCLGARRSIPVTDADFFQLDVSKPIVIDITIGGLIDSLKSLDAYGLYLRAFREDGTIEDEPHEEAETVLTARLKIESDLDPQWSLFSERSIAQEMSRNLSWGDRTQIAPTRIGSFASNHFTWNKASILTRLTDETADNSSALAEASRQARNSFGESADEQLSKTLGIVDIAAKSLGVDCGDEISALLDAHSVSFSGGNISLHDEAGVPLKNLGLGSTRLLVAGLQKYVMQESTVILVDEVEHGLEPHRIARFLNELGSKSTKPKTQVFMTTHSPVVLRELSGKQVFILRPENDKHETIVVGDTEEMQGTLRHSAEAFLGSHVLICEGATEIGLIRGIDLYRSDTSQATFLAAGGVLVDAGGVSKIYNRAKAFQSLQYNVAVLRDDDKQPKADDEKAFKDGFGAVFKWSDGYAIEGEIFACLSDEAVTELLQFAISVHGEELVVKHIETAIQGPADIQDWMGVLTDDQRETLAEAANHGSWFKRISIMEDAARNIIAPDLVDVQSDLTGVIDEIFKWADAIDA